MLGQKPWDVHTCCMVEPNKCLPCLTLLEVRRIRTPTLNSPATRLTFKPTVGLPHTRQAALRLRKCPNLWGAASLEWVQRSLIQACLPFLHLAVTARQSLGRQAELIREWHLPNSVANILPLTFKLRPVHPLMTVPRPVIIAPLLFLKLKPRTDKVSRISLGLPRKDLVKQVSV